MTKILLVPGTWAFLENYYEPNSSLRRYLATQGLEVNGVFRWTFAQVFNPMIQHDWQRGGEELAWALAGRPFADRNVIAHSHGGQLATYAAAYGVPIRRLLTIGTPNRRDWREIRCVARKTLDKDGGRWRHVIDKRFDYWGQLGSLFDGAISFNRGIREAHDTVRMPGAGHGDLLKNPALFPLWSHNGLIDHLR